MDSKEREMHINGFRIAPEEIESTLRNHPVVAEAAAVADRGKYSERLTAWVVCKPDAEAGAPELREHMKKTLPEHMVPSVFIFTDRLPLTAGGEIDRTALSFDAAERGSGGGDEMPRNQLESVVAGMLQTVTGQEGIGIHDDFLDIGGDSIQAGLLALKIRECFNVEIPLPMFAENMTAAKLAEEIYYCQQ